MARHTAGDRMNREANVLAFVAQTLGDFENDVLRVSDGHAVARHDDNLLGTLEQFRGFRREDLGDFAFGLGASARAATRGTEAAGDDANEVPIHGSAHDVTQDCAATADQGAGDD